QGKVEVKPSAYDSLLAPHAASATRNEGNSFRIGDVLGDQNQGDANRRTFVGRFRGGTAVCALNDVPVAPAKSARNRTDPLMPKWVPFTLQGGRYARSL